MLPALTHLLYTPFHLFSFPSQQHASGSYAEVILVLSFQRPGLAFAKFKAEFIILFTKELMEPMVVVF